MILLIGALSSGGRSDKSTMRQDIKSKLLMILCNYACFTILTTTPVFSYPGVGSTVAQVAEDSSRLNHAQSAESLRDLADPKSGEILKDGKLPESHPTSDPLWERPEAWDKQRIDHKDRIASWEKQNIKNFGYRTVALDYMRHSEDSNLPLYLEALRAAEQEVKSERWWFKFTNFFRSIFKRREWKKQTASLRLRALSRKFAAEDLKKVARHFELESRIVVNRLTILENRGFEFSDGELRLIKLLAHGDIDPIKHIESLSLMHEISNETVAQRKLRPIQQLETAYSAALKDASDKPNILPIMGALKQLRKVIAQGEKWSNDKAQLVKNLEKLIRNKQKFGTSLVPDKKTTALMEKLFHQKFA
ncbi:hypothetical protein PGT21_031315 [Puccinia graminis f. sp. tritici]|nr:hypothetical protein PGT21_031315 [Puccinia graminis f. sp. tritici]